MVWTAKPSAPAYFSLADAFIALVTGDPVWGWLVDWATLVPNTGTNTAAFCAAGPPDVNPFTSDLFNQAPGPSALGQSGHIAALIVAMMNAAQDRVFGAYCEQVPASGLCDFVELDSASVSPGHDGAYRVVATVPIRPGVSQLALFINNTSSLNLAFKDASLQVGTNLAAGATAGITYTVAAHPGIPTMGNYVLSLGGNAGGTGNVRVVITQRATCGPGGGDAYVPEAQPQPAGVLSPIRTVEPTLVGIADEVERLELKLDTLLMMIQGIAGATLDLGGETQAPADFVADVPVAVGDAVGCVITTTGIPASRAIDFGTPQNVVRLAHLNCGTADAWFPSIWVTHTPFILRPLPPGTTRITITDLPPGASSTIALIARNK
jgi:hypothetical protein